MGANTICLQGAGSKIDYALAGRQAAYFVTCLPSYDAPIRTHISLIYNIALDIQELMVYKPVCPKKIKTPEIGDHMI